MLSINLHKHEDITCPLACEIILKRNAVQWCIIWFRSRVYCSETSMKIVCLCYTL